MTRDTRAILWLAAEDYAGLWEAVWELRSIHPGADDAFLVNRARAILSDLAARGLIQLYRCQEPSDHLWPVENSRINELLSHDVNWLDPKPEQEFLIRFSATPAGEAEVLPGTR